MTAPNDPVRIATEFMTAMAANDEPAMRALMVRGSEEFNFNPEQGGAGRFQVGEAEPQDDCTVVPVTMVPEEGEEPEQTMPLVLVEEDGAWKVDLQKSMERMLGFDPQALMEQMAEGMGEAMKGLGEAMASGMEQVAEGLGEALGGGSGPNVREIETVEEDADPPEDPRRS